VIASSYPFLDVMWTMFVFFAWVMVVFLVVTLMVDNLRRRDHSGWAKAGWTLLLIFAPLIGCLIYMVARPRPSDDDLEAFGVPAGSMR
jgi:NADH:ubiquinone oxidoreductase subunit 6 (subunit J)